MRRKTNRKVIEMNKYAYPFRIKTFQGKKDALTQIEF